MLKLRFYLRASRNEDLLVLKNFLVTGRPGSGKSTIVAKTVQILIDQGVRVGGIVCPEIRDESGQRIGFKMKNILSGEERLLAHVGHKAGPSVGKYGVIVENVDYMSETSILNSLEHVDVIVIDEIAPMETFSEKFKKAITTVLDSSKPLLAAIHMRSMTGFIGDIKKRPDVKIWVIKPENRERLPTEIASEILKVLRTEKSENRMEHPS